MKNFPLLFPLLQRVINAYLFETIKSIVKEYKNQHTVIYILIKKT